MYDTKIRVHLSIRYFGHLDEQGAGSTEPGDAPSDATAFEQEAAEEAEEAENWDRRDRIFPQCC